jgi:hypothetical protein
MLAGLLFILITLYAAIWYADKWFSNPVQSTSDLTYNKSIPFLLHKLVPLCSQTHKRIEQHDTVHECPCAWAWEFCKNTCMDYSNTYVTYASVGNTVSTATRRAYTDKSDFKASFKEHNASL